MWTCWCGSHLLAGGIRWISYVRSAMGVIIMIIFNYFIRFFFNVSIYCCSCCWVQSCFFFRGGGWLNEELSVKVATNLGDETVRMKRSLSAHFLNGAGPVIAVLWPREKWPVPIAVVLTIVFLFYYFIIVSFFSSSSNEAIINCALSIRESGVDRLVLRTSDDV